MAVSVEQIEDLLGKDHQHPTMGLLTATSRGWVIPLFARHLEPFGTVSADEFHVRVAETLEHPDVPRSDRTPAEHCRKWLGDRWIESLVKDERTYYRLSSSSLRALQFVRELAGGESAVGSARVASIEFAIETLAAAADPDRQGRIARIDARIAELEAEKQGLETGRSREASTSDLRGHLREIQILSRTLPADFRSLQAKIAESHKAAARRAWNDTPPKAELLEDYLDKNESFSSTAEGAAYDSFTELLTHDRARKLNAAIDHVLEQPFAREHMSAAEREEFRNIVSTLNRSRHEVDQERMRWKEFLRRVVTRSSLNRNKHINALAQRAMSAGATWAAKAPGHRTVPTELLGIGTIEIEDMSQIRLWEDEGPAKVSVAVRPHTTGLSRSDVDALRLAAGTGHRAVRRHVNALLEENGRATGAQVLEAMPPDNRRLGTAISLIDLAVEHGSTAATEFEIVELLDAAGTATRWQIPLTAFTAPVPSKENA